MYATWATAAPKSKQEKGRKGEGEIAFLKKSTRAIVGSSVALLLSVSASVAQTISAEGHAVVAAAPEHRWLYEPQLAHDPTNARRWLAVAMMSGVGETFEQRVTGQTCRSFDSADDGRTWNVHEFPVTRGFDPWVIFTPTGTAIISMLGVVAPPDKALILFVFRSDDGGRTWGHDPITLGPGHDHPVLTVDSSGSIRNGWVYLTSHRGTRADDGTRRWSVFVARSRDAGRTFENAASVVPNNLHNLAEMPAVLSDGTLVVPFVDASHTSDEPIATTDFDRRRAWVMRSSDGGKTFSIPLFVNDACGPPPGFRLSALAADISPTASRDRLYFACRKGGGPITVSASSDRGETWSVPASVTSQDQPAEERIPAMAVNKSGNLLVAWIDGDERPGHQCEQTVFVAASADGGRTFSTAERISTAAPCADVEFVASPTGGDYFGLVPMPDGRFRLLWSEPPGGASRLMTTIVSVK